MTPVPPYLRYERKFVAEGFSLAEILAGVRRHPAAFREIHPERVVNNVYLDSPTRRNYHDHVNGVAHRTKTRVRWYGPKWEVAEGHTLERKLKQGIVSGKESYKLPPLTIHDRCLSSRLGAAFAATHLPNGVRAALRHLEPALFNRYRRQYFLSRDRKFRLTVDFSLQFAGIFPSHQPAINLSAPKSTMILELKYGPEVAEEAYLLTNAFSFRLARFSKYVAGIELTGTG